MYQGTTVPIRFQVSRVMCCSWKLTNLFDFSRRLKLRLLSINAKNKRYELFVTIIKTLICARISINYELLISIGLLQ
jgi:hypothetical protein